MLKTHSLSVFEIAAQFGPQTVIVTEPAPFLKSTTMLASLRSSLTSR
jgi:hypothetical protein